MPYLKETTMRFKLADLASPLLAVALLSSVGGQSTAFAVEADDAAKPVKVKKHKARAAKRQTDAAPYLYGSNETQKMRDKRLSRECKGAANGGACRGYTQ
jgi:hypothetical protein